jgi:two-component system, OmpR family, sensor histidine kinase KdpD
VRGAIAGRDHNSIEYLRRLTGALTRCKDLVEIFTVIEGAFRARRGWPMAIFLLQDGKLRVAHHSSGFIPDTSDLASAAQAVSSSVLITPHAASTGCSHLVPLTSWKGTLGALGFRTNRKRPKLPDQEMAFVEFIANQTSLAILRAESEEEARNADLLSNADRLQKALLHAISHNVKTPLASIIGVLSTLREKDGFFEPKIYRDLLDTAQEQAQRLNRLLGNLLDLSRLEAGVLPVRNDPCDVQDLVGSALEQLGLSAREREIDVKIPGNLPFVHMDFVLIVQVLVNLLDNALKYSSGDTPITVEARLLSTELQMSVSDCGTGIPEGNLQNVFQKFDRAGRTGETGGVGLGLFICKGFVEAHHGKIWATGRQPFGTKVAFTIPLQTREGRKKR